MRIALVMHPWDTIVPPEQQTNSMGMMGYEIARRLACAHEVVLYAQQGRHQPRWEVDRHGVQIRRIPGMVRSAYQLFERVIAVIRPASPLFFSPSYFFPYIYQVARDIRQYRMDIIQVLTLPQFIPPLRISNPDAKIVLHMHDNTLLQRHAAHTAAQLRQADLILVCSHYVIDNVRSRFPHLRVACRVLHNGVDVRHFAGPAYSTLRIQSPGTRVLFVGRVGPEKGLHILIEAFCAIMQSVPDCSLHVIGQPGLLPYSPHIALSTDEQVTA